MNPSKDPFVIIGSGAAGIAAAETIRQNNPKVEIHLITKENETFYSRPGLAYYLSGEIPENQLFPFTQEKFKNLNLHFIQGPASQINPTAKKVILKNGKALPYNKLLIATGAAAVRANVPGENLPGVVYLDSIEDVRQILKLAKKGKTAVVVGGGITALELVEGLHARGVHTHYFLRRDRYWGNVLDEIESKVVESRLQQSGVRLHYNTELAEIIGKATGIFGKGEPSVNAIKTQDGISISCDLVGIAIGVRPIIHLAKEAGLAVDRGILVNEYLETSIPGIFAAGDAAQVYDPELKKTTIDILWPVARDQGRVAGHNMFGNKTAYTNTSPLNVTRLAGLTTTIIGNVGSGAIDEDVIGIVRGDSDAWRIVPDAIAAQNNFDINHIRLMVGQSTIVGAVIMGDQSLSRVIQSLIDNKIDISSIRQQLIEPGANIPHVIAEFWKSSTNHE